MKPISLDALPTVLTVADCCAVFRISRAHYYRLLKRGEWPIPPMPVFSPDSGKQARYSGVLVRRYLSGEWAPAKKRIRR